MSKNLRDCPRCDVPGLIQEFVVTRRETCINCSYISQYRITPIVEGGYALLDALIDHFLEVNTNNAAIETALRNQLAKLQSHQAKSRARNDQGKPTRKEG